MFFHKMNSQFVKKLILQVYVFSLLQKEKSVFHRKIMRFIDELDKVTYICRQILMPFVG